MRLWTPLLLLYICAHADAQLSVTLAPETTQAFEAYVAKVEPQLAAKAREKKPLPWIGDNPEEIARVKRGEVAIRSYTGKNGQEVPQGLIHDWLGAVFIPATTVDKVIAVLQGFDRHKQWYPEIIDSKLIAKNGNEVRGSWTLKRKKVLTVVLRADITARYAETGPGQWFVKSSTWPIREVADYGQPNAHEYPPGQGHGFFWRMMAYWDLHQADGGVYAECRAISLSRDVPSGLGWIINPFIRSMPTESVTNTLKYTRDAVKKL